MTDRPQRHVFLSHVREDAKRVERLAADLRQRGIESWIDRHRIKPGQRWEIAIEEAIRAGSFFIACFSRASLRRARSHMNEELHVASKEVRRRQFNTSWFIPLRLNKCQIPDWPIAPELSISSFQWLDMFPDWSQSVERLAEAIEPSRRSAYPLDALAVFRDVDANWCPELVMIPPGELLLDFSRTGKESNARNGRRRAIAIPAHFALGRYPVTFEEYERFVEATHQIAPST
jgi:hypothetical protein